MIGQINLLKQIDKLIEENKFPRFSIITGQKGQGKTELSKEIISRLTDNFQLYGFVVCELNVEYIRNIIDMSYKQTKPILYLLYNADNMSLNAQNSLLKVIEEPPNNAMFLMTLTDINNTLETIRSRCQEFKMENYTKNDLIGFINEFYTPIDLFDKDILLDICQNKYQMDLMMKYKPQEFYQFVEKVVDNIYKVQSANAFKLEEKLDIKGDGDGYDLDLFFNTFMQICSDRMQGLNFPEDFLHLADSIEITSKYKNKLNIKGINKMRNFRPDG